MRFKKSTFWVQKVHFWGSRTPMILATGLLVRDTQMKATMCHISIKKSLKVFEAEGFCFCYLPPMILKEIAVHADYEMKLLEQTR